MFRPIGGRSTQRQFAPTEVDLLNVYLSFYLIKRNKRGKTLTAHVESKLNWNIISEKYVHSVVSDRANRLKSGGTPLGDSSFGRKDRNSYIHTTQIMTKRIAIYDTKRPFFLSLRQFIVLRLKWQRISWAVDDGVNTFKALTRFVPGAGATEIELAKQISSFGEA